MQESIGMTLVLGGTGKTGKRIVSRLEAMGLPVRTGSRLAAPAFSWEDPASWPAALSGVSNLYVAFAPDLAVPGATQSIRTLTELAVKQGVKRIVLLSGRGEAEAQACERIIQRADIQWSIVRASWFMQNFSEGAFADMLEQGVVRLPAGKVREPFVDADDIAEVAVAALTQDGHQGQIYEVTGPQLLSFADVTAAFAKATGRQITYQQISNADFIAGAKAAGVPEDYLWLLDYLFTTVLDGRNEHLSNGVQQALHRKPRELSVFINKLANQRGWKAAA